LRLWSVAYPIVTGQKIPVYAVAMMACNVSEMNPTVLPSSMICSVRIYNADTMHEASGMKSNSMVREDNRPVLEQHFRRKIIFLAAFVGVSACLQIFQDHFIYWQESLLG